MPIKTKFAIFFIVAAFAAGMSAFSYFVIKTGNDSIILNKDPWKGIDLKEPFYTRALLEDEIPHRAIKIFSNNNQCQPNSFKVKAGEKVILILRSDETFQHMINFTDESLNLVKIITDGKDPRGIMFQAPFKAGEYIFYCGQAASKVKQKGTMIVK